VHDTVAFWAYNVCNGGRTRIVGPNCPGVISPGQSNAGIIPADITSSGRIGLVSKSGTLTYQMMYELRDIGFSTCVGIGGDPVIGTTHIDCIQAFEDDPDTDAIVMIGKSVGTPRNAPPTTSWPTSPNPWSHIWPGSPPLRARPWDTPGLSSPDLPALPAPRRQPSKPPGSRSARPRPRRPTLANEIVRKQKTWTA